jgi:hypothetical protein
MNLEEFIDSLPEGEKAELMLMAEGYKDSLLREKGQVHFMEFVKAMWPGFIHGRHHALMAKKFEEIAAGKTKRLIINMPPRHTKSEFASYMLPAWFLGKFPNKKIIQCSNTAELAVGFGRMPVSKSLPYQWYNTPNVRVLTVADFEKLASSLGLQILDQCILHEGRQVTLMPNLFGSLALFRVRRA